MKRLVLDLDGTLTVDGPAKSYLEKLPNLDLIRRVREYKANGFEIIVMTSRNMRTHNNSVGKINALTLPVIIDWLRKHDVPFDEVHVGKPWCGTDGFYVDDRAVRPSEFENMKYDSIALMLANEREKG